MTADPFAPSAAERAVATQLRHRFPTVPVWFGEHTRHWWALAADRLVEAGTPQELAAAVAAVLGAGRPPVSARPPRGLAGTWRSPANPATPAAPPPSSFVGVPAPVG